MRDEGTGALSKSVAVIRSEPNGCRRDELSADYVGDIPLKPPGVGEPTADRLAAGRVVYQPDGSVIGLVQPRAVHAIEDLIEAEVRAGTYVPAAEPSALAYAIVRLAEAFLYNDAAIGIRGDHERLRQVEAALLGLSPTPRRRLEKASADRRSASGRGAR